MNLRLTAPPVPVPAPRPDTRAAARPATAPEKITPNGEKLLVVGAGVAGLYTAISGARAGFDVTVLEMFDEQASRRTLFNLAPSVADSLQKLDNGGSRLSSVLTPIRSRYVADSYNNEFHIDNQGAALRPDASRPTTADTMIAGFRGIDRRPWGRVSIGGIENRMREYIRETLPGVKMQYNSSVGQVLQDDSTVLAEVKRPDGTTDVIEGAYLVSATGGHNALGIKRSLFPEHAHFVGGLFEPVKSEEVELPRMLHSSDQLSRETQHANPPGRPYPTVGLNYDARDGQGTSLVWCGIADDAKRFHDDDLREVVRDRAKLAEVSTPLIASADNLLKVNVQLGMVANQPVVDGRVMLVGDEILAPYFPTSTGGGHALGVNGPIAAKALDALGALPDDATAADRAKVMSQYDRDARRSAEKVMRVSYETMLHELGLPQPDWEACLDRLKADGKVQGGIGEVAP